jgi:transcriptional regulator with XRE-family HTH domain
VTPGNELKTARERLSLSREQISCRTKINVRKITALEQDEFDQLPTGIYLDGIAAAYAREVGLDAETFIRRLRTHVAPPPETLERIAAARQSAKHRPREMGLSVAHSMGAFAAVAIVLAIAGVGVKLYPGPFVTERQRVTVTGTLADREPATKAEIGSQFRWERGTTGSEPVTEPAGRPPVAEPTPPAEPVEIHPMTLADVERPPLSSLTGVWRLETEVESSSVRAFKGLRLGFRLELRQNGDRIEGTGQKVTENGIALSGARRTAITVHGTLGEGRMRLTFGEQGAVRRTTGTLDLIIDKNGVLRGVFASEAARSAGAVEARRL